MKIKKELYKAQKYDIVSFDIFDTLIERNVEKPTDIFFQVGVGCFSNYEMAMDFQKRRIIAEHIARNISKTGEVNLDDIYNALEGQYHRKRKIIRSNFCFIKNLRFLNIFK